MAQREIICWGLVVLLGIAVALYARHRWQEYHNPIIEYDEEVKLHDSSMIWVHIKRHYVLVGEIGQKSGYLPGIVEISWDTGFKGVEKKSLIFRENLGMVQKIHGQWYVSGFTPLCKSPCIKDEYVQINPGTSIAIIDKNGNFIKNNLFKNSYPKSMNNIYHLESYSEWEHLSAYIDDGKLFWNTKQKLKHT